MGHARLLGLQLVQFHELALHTVVPLRRQEEVAAETVARRSGLPIVRQLDLRVAAVVPLV